MAIVDIDNILRCSRCSYEWVPRKDGAPKRCPKCRSIKWNMPYLTVRCKRCGHQWNSHNGSPKRCPECGTHQWNVPPKSYTCKRCEYTWNSKGNKMPKRCPVCSSKDWNTDRVLPERRIRTVSYELDDAMLYSIIDNYRKGLSCVDISIACRVPYSVVFGVVRNHSGNMGGPI